MSIEGRRILERVIEPQEWPADCDAAPPVRREQKHLEMDALNSILRVLEPLGPEQRERCLAAARCMFNQQAALRAVEAVDSWL